MLSRQYCFKEQQQCSSSKFKYLKDCSGNIPTSIGLNFFPPFFGSGKPFYTSSRLAAVLYECVKMALIYKLLLQEKTFSKCTTENSSLSIESSRASSSSSSAAPAVIWAPEPPRSGRTTCTSPRSSAALIRSRL